MKPRFLPALALVVYLAVPFQAEASFYPRGARAAGSLYVKAVASTTRSACAIKQNGTLWCWGDNSSGLLGNGTSTDSTIPVQVTALSNVIEVSAGSYHICAITADRSLYCWGDNLEGRVGTGVSGGDFNTPQLVTIPGGLKPLRVALSLYATCVLLEDATVRCWGSNVFGELGDASSAATIRTSPPATSIALTGVTELKASAGNFCALTVIGDVHCWGSNWLGQIGIGVTGGDYNTPQKVHLFSIRRKDHEEEDDSLITTVHPVGLTLGLYFACANTDSGQVYCWGGNGYGQLGTGNTTAYNVPELATEFSGFIVDQVEAGDEFTCIVTRGGSVRCLGNNVARYNPATTANSLTPVLLSGAGSVKFIAVANTANSRGSPAPESGGLFAVQNSGLLQSWGQNQYGQLGRGLVSTFESFGQTMGMSAGSVVDINPLSAGANHSCFIDHRSRLKCAGDDTYGQLGDGGAAGGSSSTPVSVTGYSGNALMITSGNAGNHNCAIKAGNTVACWGRNNYAQVDSSLTNRTSAVTVPVIADATSVAVGNRHSCILRKQGTIYCWGYNGLGQIGNGAVLPAANATAPTKVINLNLAFPYPVQVVAGADHTCSLDAAGKVRCWGSNSQGQLGDGTYTNTSTPVFVKTSAGVALENIMAIAAGGNTTCGLNASGSIYCWGANNLRQLGNAVTSVSVNVAQTAVTLPARATHFALGQGHGCAGLVTGKTYCWGDNAGGKGSIGSLASPITPPALAKHSAAAGDDVVSMGLQGAAAASYFITRKAAPAQSCGFNFLGNLGDGTTAQRSYAGNVLNFL